LRTQELHVSNRNFSHSLRPLPRSAAPRNCGALNMALQNTMPQTTAFTRRPLDACDLFYLMLWNRPHYHHITIMTSCFRLQNGRMDGWLGFYGTMTTVRCWNSHNYYSMASQSITATFTGRRANTPRMFILHSSKSFVIKLGNKLQ